LPPSRALRSGSPGFRAADDPGRGATAGAGRGNAAGAGRGTAAGAGRGTAAGAGRGTAAGAGRGTAAGAGRGTAADAGRDGLESKSAGTGTAPAAPFDFPGALRASGEGATGFGRTIFSADCAGATGGGEG